MEDFFKQAKQFQEAKNRFNSKSPQALFMETSFTRPCPTKDDELREKAARIVMRSLGSFNAQEAEKVYQFLKGRYDQNQKP